MFIIFVLVDHFTGFQIKFGVTIFSVFLDDLT